MIRYSIKNTHCSMVSWCVTYKCHNTKDKNSNLILRNGKIAKLGKNRTNRGDLPMICLLI